MWTLAFWKDTIERFAWTALQAGLAVFAVDGWGIEAIKVAVIAAALSFAKGIAANFTHRDGTAQLGITTYRH